MFLCGLFSVNWQLGKERYLPMVLGPHRLQLNLSFFFFFNGGQEQNVQKLEMSAVSSIFLMNHSIKTYDGELFLCLLACAYTLQVQACVYIL